MSNKKDVEERIRRIEERNKRVELDKRWETSLTRKLVIFLLTYIVIVVFFFTAGLPRPFMNSIVPALAYLVSTFSLPFFKQLWKRYTS